ncbi:MULTISPECIES: AAA family ATPase [unclassified Nocardia]|uniref:AAA family ATPase n=1 Tax=unclassified Nocardia TaxID=2637762 RepID=UPI001CE3CBEF|nr:MULTISPECIES: AAA family ATPase [unclassified Nocardia]
MTSVEEEPLMCDLEAEQQILGAALYTWDNTEVAQQVADIPTEAFYRPAHQLLHATMVDMLRDGHPADPAVIIEKASSRGELGGNPHRLRQLTLEMLGKGVPGSVPYFADRIITLWRARTAITEATRMIQKLQSLHRTGDLEFTGEVVQRAREGLDLDFTDPVAPGAAALPPSVADVLAGSDSYDWLIPQLFEYGDRMILTGIEGLGKSTLLAQIACAVTAGLHPFLAAPITGAGAPDRRSHRVLVIDAENLPGQLRRRYRDIVGRVDGVCDQQLHPRPDWHDELRIESRPDGVRLEDPRELRRIEAAIAAHQPALVVAGPLYRLNGLDTETADGARELVRILDRLRVKYRFALILEGHIPHAADGRSRSVRPIGSSLLLRWPEFGYGIVPGRGHEDEEHPKLVNLRQWRYARDARLFPHELHQSTSGFPWTPGGNYFHLCRNRGVFNG